MSEDKEYREGDEEDVPKETKEPGAERPIPNTAFLVMSFDNGRLEVIPDVPDLPKNHTASMREIRDIAHSLYEDMHAALTARTNANEMLRVLTEAQKRVVSGAMPQNTRDAAALIDAQRRKLGLVDPRR